MTTIDRSMSSRRRGRSTTSGGRGRRIVRAAWAVAFLVVVPALAGYYVDQQAGNAWGAIPAFWLAGDPTPTAVNTAAGLAFLVAAAGCALLYRLGSRLATR